jgi:hypothetical protein
MKSPAIYPSWRHKGKGSQLPACAELRLSMLGVALIFWTTTSKAATIHPEALARAQPVYEQNFRQHLEELRGGVVVNPAQHPGSPTTPLASSLPVLRVIPQGGGAYFPARFEAPPLSPAFFVFEVEANHSGRLIVHLEPDQLPESLAKRIPEKDWANPERRYDFRTVVEFQQGQWQRFALDSGRLVPNLRPFRRWEI